MTRGGSLADLFMENVRQGPSGCWEWVGRRDRKGYGVVTWWNGGSRGAHRVAWMLYRGPIPEGFQIDHLCRNHGCVCPMHLQPVTPRENQMRGMTKLKRTVAKTHCPHGHPYSGDNLIIRKSGARRCRACHNESRRKRDGVSSVG